MAPAEKQPPPLQPCPCADRQVILPNARPPEKVVVASVLPAVLPVQESLPILAGVVSQFGLIAHLPTPDLQVLDCVWLC
jgi:hypothetical protein